MSSPPLKLSSKVWVIALIIAVFLGVCSAQRFLGDVETFAKYPKWDACLNASISFEFRTRQKDALLMYTDDNGKYDYLQVALTDGAVRLWINLDREDHSGEIELGRNLNDGNWHHVEVKRNRMETRLMVDETQSSMVSLGSDLNFGDRLETNNYMYFGGVPSNYRQNLLRLNIPASVLNTNFVGELRNILYFNCSCLPARASMLEGRGVDQRYREACDTRNPCPRDCTCLSRDDGAICECDFKRECIRDLHTHYHLPMDRLERDLILNPSGLDSRAYGGPELVSGVHGSALKLDGRSQWLRVSGPNHKDECLGDLDLCPRGYYVGFWVKFESAPDQKSVFLSNGGHSADGHGIAMSYSKTGLEFVFKAKDGREWRVKERDVLPGRWYHVAASWIADKGLFLYVNGHQVAQERSPVRTEAARDSNPYKDFVIGRANDNVGIRQLTPVIVDDFSFSSSFKSEDEAREEGPAFQYYLPLNGIQGEQVEAIGTNAKLQGRVQLSPGKIKQAFTFMDRNAYISLGDARDKCLGDLEKCKQGIYISFFINFKQLDNDRGYIFSSPHGLDIYQTGSQLVAVAQRNRTVWEARYNGLNPRTWYFVEVSWSVQDGLSIYVDGRLVDKKTQESYSRERRSTRETQAFIGRDNEGGRREYLNGADLDDVTIFYDSRDVLSNIGFIRSGQPNYHHFNFENVRGNRLVHDKMNIELIGSHEQTNGKVGKALRLNGNNEYANFGDHSSDCFGNLDLCPHGVLYSMWLRPERLRNKMYFLTTGDNGINLVYRGQKLHASASTSANQWEVSTSNIDADRWYYVEVSFHPLRGLALYINNELVAEDGKPRGRQTALSSTPEYNRFYLGRGNLDMSDAKYAAATFDELEMWYADRDFLSAHSYVQRSRPQRFFVDFEELIDEDRLLHQVLPIRLVGRPGLIPGKVNNALELRGRGQYADLGRRGGECFSSLTECKHGITVAGWMRFNRFENNMVFLSTGENGILMLHRDGNIEVTADGRSRISIPRFETGRWYFVEITWHPDTGLELYVDNELRGRSGKEYVNPSNQGNFYLGQPNPGDVLADRYSTGNFDVDELEIWYRRREDLLAFGYINRGTQYTDFKNIHC